MGMLNSAIHHLSQKTYSEREIYDVLAQEFSEESDLEKILGETLSYLKKYELVHDARLARNIATHYAHKGNQFIRDTLKQRNISAEDINVALKNIPDEHTRALEEAEKKLNNELMYTLPKKEQINVISRYLSGRKFNFLVIKDIVNKLNSNAVYKIKAMNNSSLCWVNEY